jgi:chloramphenicol-sensitive protein RarD
VLFAISAYVMWGVAPLYFKQLIQVPALDILMHRIIWSVVLLAFMVLTLNQLGKVREVLRHPKLMAILLIASLLLAGNWGLFIWAVNNNHMLDASLGYYINPLINVALGRLFLAERLRPLQKLAVGIAAVGVTFLVVAHGQLPWIALLLAFSFSIYGLLRKQLPVDAIPGLFLETLVLLPPALVYWWWFASPQGNMFDNTISMNMLLVAAGIVTTAPLLCFTAAAKRIMYSTLGFFQYIGPSLMFLLAVLLYQEELHTGRLLTFALVWTALLLFSVDSLRAYRQQRKLRGVALD